MSAVPFDTLKYVREIPHAISTQELTAILGVLILREKLL